MSVAIFVFKYTYTQLQNTTMGAAQMQIIGQALRSGRAVDGSPNTQRERLRVLFINAVRIQSRQPVYVGALVVDIDLILPLVQELVPWNGRDNY